MSAPNQQMVNEICEALDPNYQMIAARLGRESTLLKNGQYVKDLSYLNRPLSDILVLDSDLDKCKLHPQNVLILPRWEGETTDRELYDILPFLESNFIL
jgi:import inner membrane translocase subunit TIM50